MATATASATVLDQNVARFISKTQKILINGKSVEAASGKTFPTYNPATGEVLSLVAEGDREDIDRAVKAARAAFETGPWSKITPSERGRMIWKLGDLIEKHLEEFAQLESLDNGKPSDVARVADVPLAADLFRYMAGWATKIEGNTIPISAGGGATQFLAYTVREPVGVVGQIIPWNFPAADGGVEAGPGARNRLHGRAETCRTNASQRASARRIDSGSRHSRRRGEYRARLRRDRGRCFGGPSGRGQSRFHWLDGSRQADSAGRCRESEKGFAGAGRKIAECGAG